jgi:WD40 repeat protein
LQIPLDCTMTALDPKFERLALCRGTNSVEIHAAFDQSLLATLPASTNEPATFGKWSPNGQFFVVRRSRGLPGSAAAIEVWDIPSARQVLLLPVTPLGAFSFHPSLPRVLCGDTNNSVSVWDMETGAELAKFAVTGIVHHVEFSPDGKSFIVQHRIDRPWFTSLHDATSGIVRTSVLSGWVDSIAWHPQDRWVAFAARVGEIHLHDRKTGITSILGRHKNEARTAVFSPDGDFLFTGGEEQEIICWDLRTMQRAFTVGLQSARLQFRADGEQCAVETKAGLLLHAFERSMPYRALAGDLGGHIRRAVLSPNGRWLAVSGGARLGVWDLAHAAPPVIAAEAEQPTPLFSPDSSELFAFWANSWSNCFVRWRIGPGAQFSSPPKLESLPALNLESLPVQKPWRVLNAAFSSDALVVSTGSGVAVTSVEEVSRNPVRFFGIDHSRAEVSPDGHWLATGRSEVLDLIGLHPWTLVKSREFESDLLAVAFGPRSDELAIATHTGVTFLETNRWDATRRFPVMLDRNARLMFTPDGHGCWLAQDARTAALHDTETFATLLPLPNGMVPLAVSPDGRHVVMAVDGERLQVWELEELRERLRALGVNW